MADFPYTPQPSSIPKFFAHVQSASVPPKVTQKYFPAAGFKSSNDRYLLPLLRALGFIDGSGQPTDVWREYRKKDQAKAVMGAAIRSAYAGVFGMYEDAWRKDKEALLNYFGGATSVGATTVERIVQSFQTLCQLADFESEAPTLAEQPRGDLGGAGPTKGIEMPSGVGGGSLTVNPNIQLQLPPTEDASIYEKLFAAMKKHLLS
jgi:hypothetical protein